jgi:hypothetical protein
MKLENRLKPMKKGQKQENPAKLERQVRLNLL